MKNPPIPHPEERTVGRPDGPDDVINKYGTYEVQRNADMENRYPMIAAGLAPEQAEELRQAARQWRKKKP